MKRHFSPSSTPPRALRPAAAVCAVGLVLVLLQACSTQPAAPGAPDAKPAANAPPAKPAAAATAAPARTPTPPAAATPPSAAASAASTTANAGANAGAARPGFPPPGVTPGAPPPFGTVIKDAQRVEGPLTLWQKEDKVWIELLPKQLGQPFLCRPRSKTASVKPGCWAV